MDKQIRVAIYARYSRLLSGQSLENQLIPLRALALQRGFTVVQEHCDEGISGAKERRPGLDRLIKEAYLGKFSIVLVAAIDRIGRDVRHLLNLLHELDAIGVGLISQRESIDFTTPLGRATLIILSAISNMELESTRERIKIALATKKLIAQQQGTNWRCGRPSVVNKVLSNRILELYGEGHSIRSIQKLLEKRIGHSTIARVIQEHRVQAIAQHSIQESAVESVR